jgi:hypothetical protein
MATLGCSKVAATLRVIFGEIGKKTPHHTTIRNWMIRNGCYNLKKPIEKSDDWIAIADVTIGLGKLKCLAILGVQMSKLKKRTDYTLNHKNVEILGLHLTEKATGEFAYKSFEETRNRIGFDFLGAVTDQGPDIRNGGKQFQGYHPNTVIIHEIPHKMSLVMERTLKDDVMWTEFTKKIAETKRFIQQTELAAMLPPNQRSKARFMDIGYILDWPERVLEAKKSGRLDSIPEGRYQQYFGWIKEFLSPISNWKFMVGALDMIKGICREHGLSHDTYEYLRLFFAEASSSIDDDALKEFLKNALKAVEEESRKLKEGEVMLCSTEVLESIFGKYKELNYGSQGINGNILGLATFVGPELTEQTVKEAMEGCSTNSGINWIKQKVGNTLGSLRHRFFREIKGTKFDSELARTFTP